MRRLSSTVLSSNISAPAPKVALVRPTMDLVCVSGELPVISTSTPSDAVADVDRFLFKSSEPNSTGYYRSCIHVQHHSSITQGDIAMTVGTFLTEFATTNRTKKLAWQGLWLLQSFRSCMKA